MTKGREITVIWQGPFSWPSYESKNHMPPVPQVSGVYLQTFEYDEGYIIYCAGITRRSVYVRFKEHSHAYTEGSYNVLDVDAIRQGVRKEIWHGWDYARKHPEEFEERKDLILGAVDKQLIAFSIFVAELGNEPRLLERVEAGIMQNLYQQPSPICDIPDQGMYLSAKWDSEDTIVIKNECPFLFHGLPNYLEI